ncbi:FHA domain-containing protein PS1 [Humulus lupulus]|uniref:FHA domain-containing protein PS1 n=1 Tax=Humulus lupulus TaxID=3486 RepID=UPI002B407895|nr:FHA domain-containing protein PS1 [Humulus lupulus]
MATTNEYKLSHEQELKIPVFTVFKNGAILKNIFIVNNNNPQIPTQEHEEILIVGRHPDCNIMLTHPSISRFHLQILSNPSLQKLSVIDLSSVHGTWVSEKKIDPCVRVELKEGDSLRIGGSSRVYRLYWIPFNQAYDLETPYESVSDVPIPGEEIEMEVYRHENSMMIENKPIEEENNSMTVEPKAHEGKCEGNDHLLVVNQDIQSLDLVVEGMSSLFSDESLVLSVKKEIPSAPPIPENPVFSLLDENDELAESPPKDVTEHNEIPSLCNNHFGTDSEKSYFPLEGNSLDTLGSDCHEYKGNSSSVNDVVFEIVMQQGRSPRGSEEELNHFVDRNSSFSIDKEEKVELAAQPFEETEIQQTDIESLTPEALSDVESLFLQGKQENSTGERKSNSLVDFISACSDGIPPASERIEETEDQRLSMKGNEQKDVSVDYCEPCMAESVNSSLPAWEDVQEIAVDKEKQTSKSLFEETANQRLVRKDYEQKTNPSLLLGSVFGDTETQQTDVESLTPEALSDVGSPSLQGEHENYAGERKSHSLVDSIPACSDGIPSASERIEETEDQRLPMNDNEQNDVSVDYCEPCMAESVHMSLPAWEVVQEIADEKENQTPQSIFAAGGLPQSEIIRNVSVDYCKPCMAESVHMSLPAWEVVQEIADDKENQTPQSIFAAGGLPQSEITRNSSIGSDMSTSFGSIWSRRGKAASVVPLRTGRSRLEAVQGGSDSKAAQHNQKSTEDKSIPKEMSTCLNREEELFTPDKENFIPTTLLQQKSSKKKGTPVGVIQLGTTKSRIETKWGGVHSADKYHSQYSAVHKSISKELFSCFDGEEEEIYTSDKENFTPNTLLLKSIKKKGKLEEVKHSTPCRRSSSKIPSSPKMHPEENLNVLSNEENETLRVLQERKFVKQTTSENQVEVEEELVINKRRLGMKRVPFQSLAVDSVENSRSEMLCPSSATRSSSSVNYTHTVEKVTGPFSNNSDWEGKRGWTIVVDTTTLLNKDSRKALQLLQGLKGTRLIIPRMVTRELDCLKRQRSLFGRKPEACLVLEWIEKCMTETTWWIHVQSSVEDGRLIAPTPPATPRSPFSQESGGFYSGTTTSLPFLSSGALMEILSPTTEDHILECALQSRKLRADEQHVLLSDDLTLKIQAMAEGLICETVQEFRESLINPFSERFLWADSSPRGQTWSVLDDVVLREKCNRYPSKKSSKGESAKGLKLILLHNSHYGQRSLIS